MFIITDISVIDKISNQMLDKMTAKDRLVILTGEGAMLPVTKFKSLSNLKAKTEFVEVPAFSNKSDRTLFTAFLYGKYASQVKGAEKVIVNSEIFQSIAEEAKENANLKNMFNITFLQEGGGQIKKPRVRKETKVPAAAEKDFMNHPTEDIRPAKATKPKEPDDAGKKRKSDSDGSFAAMIINNYGLQDLKKDLEKNGAALKECIKNAPDSDIGLKFQLQTWFGQEKSTKIWEAIYKDHAKLKKLAGG